MSEKIDPGNVGKLGVRQATQSDFLAKDIRTYYKYRKLLRLGVRVKRPFLLWKLQKRQTEINKIRKQLRLKPIRQIQELKKKLQLL